nr:MAG TPA: hypothetical protein [Caudoviricetes sp.]
MAFLILFMLKILTFVFQVQKYRSFQSGKIIKFGSFLHRTL